MSSSHDCSILHIDDNPRDLELLEMAFADSLGQAISYAGVTDPVAGLRQLTQGDGARPSLVILDINMPVMNGVQILEQLRKHPDFGSTPVIVFTTSKNPVERHRCLALGATAVISKPNSFAELVGVAASIIAYC